jgi:hypothetical protein
VSSHTPHVFRKPHLSLKYSKSTLVLDDRGSILGRGKTLFLLQILRPAVGPTQLPIQSVGSVRMRGLTPQLPSCAFIAGRELRDRGSSWMSRSVNLYPVTDVLGGTMCPIFTGKAVLRRFLDCLTLEDGTYRLSQRVDNYLSIQAA